MMAATTLSLPSMAVSACSRLRSYPLSTKLCPSLAFPTPKRFASASKRHSTICMITKFGNGRYIREDYLVKKVSAKEVEELVKGERTVPIVLDFYATWCGPCVLMAQELETLAVEYEKNVLFLKVDTDDEYEFARDMQVRGLPTLYFISPDPNKDAIRTEGLVPTEMIRNIIDNEL